MHAQKLFDSLSESKRQSLAGRIVKNNVILCQTALVEYLATKCDQFFSDCIENLNVASEECPDELETQEILEWWLVSDWFAEKMRQQKQPLLCNNFGTWWGRTCSGPAIDMDYNIQMLACELESKNL